MSIPIGFYQGNRSEYLAIPALSKLGFTIPVPRQEDHFGVDFIVHLARVEDKTVIPTGKSFGIQIKSDKNPLVFDKQHKRDCMYSSSLPFFLGLVSRKNLTLTIYNTLNRIQFFWMLGSTRDFTLAFDGAGDGIPKPDFEKRVGETGKPILEISIAEPETTDERLKEIETLQATMESWIDLENENLSLKEQQIALLYWPSNYTQNKPLAGDLERYSYTKFAGPGSLPNICKATEKTLTSLSFYLRKLQDEAPPETVPLMNTTCEQVEVLKNNCEKLRKKWTGGCANK